MKVPLACEHETPPGVLRECMQHMIEEPDARVDTYCSRPADLAGMAPGAVRMAVFAFAQESLVRIGREGAPIQIQS